MDIYSEFMELTIVRLKPGIYGLTYCYLIAYSILWIFGLNFVH